MKPWLNSWRILNLAIESDAIAANYRSIWSELSISAGLWIDACWTSWATVNAGMTVLAVSQSPERNRPTTGGNVDQWLRGNRPCLRITKTSSRSNGLGPTVIRMPRPKLLRRRHGRQRIEFGHQCQTSARTRTGPTHRFAGVQSRFATEAASETGNSPRGSDAIAAAPRGRWLGSAEHNDCRRILSRFPRGAQAEARGWALRYVKAIPMRHGRCREVDQYG
jgi:hypothetical protein